MTDFRALCAELYREFSSLYGDMSARIDFNDVYMERMDHLLDRTATALAQPEPQGLSDKEAVALYSEVMAVHECQTLGDMAGHFARAVLARYGTPANTINQEGYEG
jgi:hypothetical protein